MCCFWLVNPYPPLNHQLQFDAFDVLLVFKRNCATQWLKRWVSVSLMTYRSRPVSCLLGTLHSSNTCVTSLHKRAYFYYQSVDVRGGNPGRSASQPQRALLALPPFVIADCRALTKGIISSLPGLSPFRLNWVLW